MENEKEDLKIKRMKKFISDTEKEAIETFEHWNKNYCFFKKNSKEYKSLKKTILDCVHIGIAGALRPKDIVNDYPI